MAEMDTKTMSIAAALRRMKKLKGVIAFSGERMKLAATWEEGKEPAIPFMRAYEIRRDAVSELLAIKAAVSVANAGSINGDGVIAAWAIRRLDEIKSELALLAQVQAYPRNPMVIVTESRELDYSVTPARTVTREKKVVWKSAIVEVEKITRGEVLAAEFEALNGALESFNHATKVSITFPKPATPFGDVASMDDVK